MERWARDGFEHLPPPTRRSGLLAHRYLLGFNLGPWSAPGYIFGWRIAESRPDFLRLEAKSSLMDGTMLWRLQGNRLVMTTFVKYNKPGLAAWVWALAGRIHRNGAPGLLTLAANAGN